jgi:hypothetical protein
MKIEKKTYSYFVGLDLSLDTHIDDLLAVFKMVPNRCLCLQNVNKHENRKINNIFLLPRPRPYI